jgi:Icc-related predicted phosphoesterase
MIVTWVTMRKPFQRVTLEYETGNSTVINFGTTSQFRVGKKRTIFIHRALLTDLNRSRSYRYRVGDGQSFSDWFTLKARSDHTRIAFVGDMAFDGEAIKSMLKYTSQGSFEAVFHVGDIAYDLHDKGGRIGDNFFRNIEPIATQIPYQAIAGNHEKFFNFTHYDARFSMMDTLSGKQNNFFWSTNIGKVHLIGFNTEFYYYLEYGSEQIERQFTWLVKDLEEANRNRDKVPWIIAFAHKPFYCGEKVEGCYFNCEILSSFENFDIESLFKKYSVDVYLSGHDHLYRRLWPIYKGNFVDNNTVSDPYFNPNHTIHIITGLGGCDYLSTCGFQAVPGNAFVLENDPSFTLLDFVDENHLRIQQISAKSDNILDDITIVKHSKETIYK